MNDIIIVGTIASDTAVNLISSKREELKKTLSDRFLDEAYEKLAVINSKNKENIEKCNSDYYVEVSEYGIFGSLWDFAEARNKGIEVDLFEIPIQQETIEVCEVFDINPYICWSKDVYILSVKSGYDVVRMLKNSGVCATVVGKETDNNDRVILNGDERRFLTPTDREAYFVDRVK